MLVEPVAVPVPLTRMVPSIRARAQVAPGVAVTVSAAVPVVGVVPLVGDTESQLLATRDLRRKAQALPAAGNTHRSRCRVRAARLVRKRQRRRGVAVTVAAACTVRLTGTVTTVPPFGVMVMVAL